MLPSGTPVYIQARLNGHIANLLVENLSSGGATLISPDDGELRNGDALPFSALVLPEGPAIPVTPIVRWTMWPRIGVEFESISDEKEREIARFLDRFQNA
jgi:hypothetical protein